MTLDLAKVRADVKIRGMDIGLFRGVWPLEGWDYRRKVTITEQSGNDLTDYQVLVELNSTNFNFAHAQTNGEDIRFADEEGNLRDYWIEKWDAANEEAKVWVKVPSIPANSSVEIYMYYGNPSASSESDVSATFIRVIDGVVGSWHFDEGSGTTAYDSSGNNYDGTINGATWVDGKFGKALSYDGDDDYVDTADISEIELHDASFVVWVKLDTLSEDQDIITKGGHQLNEPLIIWYDVSVSSGADVGGGNTNTISILTCDGSTQHWIAASSNSINDNNWHHITAVVDITNNILKLYIDGELEASNTKAWNGIADASVKLRIGDATPSSHPFDGIIDEVLVFDKALSAEEILDLYNNYGYTTENYPGKVLVRKYTEPEPSVSVGGEETP